MSLRVAQPLKFHKKRVGEIQFCPSSPYRQEDGGKLKDREGAVYMDIAKPLPNGDGDQIDWSNKMTYKLSSLDLSYILFMARQGRFPVRVIHDNRGVKTTLTIEQGKMIEKDGDRKGLRTYCWTLGRNGTYYNVYLDDLEMFHLFKYFEAIQPGLLGWGVDPTKEAIESVIYPSQARGADSSSQDQASQH